MISMNRKYQTRDGRPVRLLCTDGHTHRPIVGYVYSELHTWLSDGRTLRQRQDILDLVPVKPPKLKEKVSIGEILDFVVEEAMMTDAIELVLIELFCGDDEKVFQEAEKRARERYDNKSC